MKRAVGCLMLFFAVALASANPPVAIQPVYQYPAVYPAYGAGYAPGITAQELRDILDEFRGKLLKDLAPQSQKVIKKEELPQPAKKKVADGSAWNLEGAQWVPVTLGFKTCVACHDVSRAAKKAKGVAFFQAGKRKVFNDRESYLVSREVFTFSNMPMGVGISKAELEDLADQVDRDVSD